MYGSLQASHLPSGTPLQTPQTSLDDPFAQDEYNQEPRYVPELNEGDGVRHQVFGTGTVVDVDGDTVTVYFRGKGTRKLNVAFAPLEKL